MRLDERTVDKFIRAQIDFKEFADYYHRTLPTQDGELCPELEYRNIPGDGALEKSSALVTQENKAGRLGILVFILADYWLVEKINPPDTLIEYDMHEQLCLAALDPITWQNTVVLADYSQDPARVRSRLRAIVLIITAPPRPLQPEPALAWFDSRVAALEIGLHLLSTSPELGAPLKARLAEFLTLRGTIKFQKHDISGAEADLKRSLAIVPHEHDPRKKLIAIWLQVAADVYNDDRFLALDYLNQAKRLIQETQERYPDGSYEKVLASIEESQRNLLDGRAPHALAEDIAVQHTKLESAPSKEESAAPHFSTYYPEAVKSEQSYALMAFIHLDSARDQVRQIATGYAEMMGDQQQSSSAPSVIKVDAGSLITFVPNITGIKFDPPEQVVMWQPPHQYATFLFRTPPRLDSDLSGRVLVYQGPLIVGEIPVSMKVVPAAVSPALNKASEFRRYDPVFASYSHRDTPVMEYFRRVRQKIGQKMLVDIYDLRAGEHWADRLLKMIDECAVFQLFWSKHSAQSPYCCKEWEYALQYIESRPRFVQPVYWQGKSPIPAPPSALAELHFQKVTIPLPARTRLAMARMRALIGK